MGIYTLTCHPQTPALDVRSVSVDWEATAGGDVLLRWQVAGATSLVVPPPAHTSERRDGLWQATCFELFLAGGGTAYREFNFSPSGNWAAYAFTSYREDMSEAPMAVTPRIAPDAGGGNFVCQIALPASVLAGAIKAGLSAVIEEKGGHKSYWALTHGSDKGARGKPDFHNPACFTLAIAAAEAP